MKKIFTLAISSLLTLAVMAADHKPSVTVKSNTNYEIVIDGKRYTGNTISLSGLNPGFHSVKVYHVKSGSFFRKKNKLVSSSDFSLKNNSITITVDRFGKIDIDEQRVAFNGNDRGRGWDSNFNKRKGYERDNQKNNHDNRF